MPIVEPNPIREKIMVWGEAGVGKTSWATNVMWWAAQAGDDRKFWFIDTDDAIPAVLLEEKYNICQNYDLKQAYDWESYMQASDWVVENAKKGDFIVVDMATALWDWVQRWDVETILNKRYAEIVDEKSRELAEQGKGGRKWRMLMHEDKNWDRINPVYHQYFSEDILLKSEAHVIFTAEASQVWKGGSPVEGQFRPGGQKRLTFQSRTDLFLEKKVWGRTVTTMKDRGRKYLEEEVYEDPFLTYFVNIAGWNIE